jgi:3-phytase
MEGAFSILISMKAYSICVVIALVSASTCNPKPVATEAASVVPVLSTQKVKHDSDDPAIWINPRDSSHVLIIGTDKGGELGDGGLYAFDLAGKIVDSVRPLKRPNNVDIAYGFRLNDSDTLIDIVVCTERLTRKIRVFRLPDLAPIDSGGIPVFEGEPDTFRDPMGIALYTNPTDQKIYAVVGRKNGPQDGTYLWQYLLVGEQGVVEGKLQRKFGFYSGMKEIESIAVDNENGFVYHSDEKYGIHKSYAHPDSSNVELALFGTTGFKEDIEGISIYKTGTQSGYILVSDQQASMFRIFPREGLTSKPHEHPELTAIPFAIVESDGSDVTSRSLPGFPKGLFVAMTDNGTFQYYDWSDIATFIHSK